MAPDFDLLGILYGNFCRLVHECVIILKSQAFLSYFLFYLIQIYAPRLGSLKTRTISTNSPNIFKISYGYVQYTKKFKYTEYFIELLGSFNLSLTEPSLKKLVPTYVSFLDQWI